MNWDSFLSSNLNSNLPSTLATILAAFVAFLVYRKQKADIKEYAARIILQEIRRAEDVINDYKEHGQYKFTKKVIATNSWAKNIHHFVGDLDQDELDRISNLYSTGEYLDKIIEKISDYTFIRSLENFEKGVTELQQKLQPQPQPQPSASVTGGTPQPDFQKPAIPLPITIKAPWKDLLDQITLKYEPIYHSTVANKLKRIARMK